MGEAKRRKARMGEAEIIFLTRERTSPWQLPPGPAHVIAIELERKGFLTRDVCRKGADWMAGAAPLRPEALFMVTVGGFDDDPREVLDIPEARQAICWFGERLREIDLATTPKGAVPLLIGRLETVTMRIMQVAMGLVPRATLIPAKKGDPALALQMREDRERITRLAAEAARRDAQPHNKQ
jgi:hypothetical protein